MNVLRACRERVWATTIFHFHIIFVVIVVVVHAVFYIFKYRSGSLAMIVFVHARPHICVSMHFMYLIEIGADGLPSIKCHNVRTDQHIDFSCDVHCR